VPIYLSPAREIITSRKERVSASFFAPFDKRVEPYIRVATGDYLDRRSKFGRDKALAAILCSIAHEIIHYQQWVHDKQLREEEANREARKILRSYAKDVPHP
jgi:hypothetical protein